MARRFPTPALLSLSLPIARRFPTPALSQPMSCHRLPTAAGGRAVAASARCGGSLALLPLQMLRRFQCSFPNPCRVARRPLPPEASVQAIASSSLKNLRWNVTSSNTSSPLTTRYACCKVSPFSVRPSASYSTQASEQKAKQEGKDLSNVEHPFDDITYNIPEKPMTFTEGASYSLVILAGLGIAGLAGYAVFKELIFEPKEYKIFGKALARIQSESQVTSRIGHPITGYGQETRNRAARQRIPNKIWTDEDGVEHVEVNFLIRGPHGAGKVYSEMFKDNSDRTWKFTYLVVDIVSPPHAKKQLMLESYLPA